MEQPQPTKTKRQAKKWEDMSAGEKFVGMTVLILVVIGAFWVLWTILGHIGGASNNSPTDNQSSQTSAQTPAYTLASLELGHTPDTATVAQYQTALDSLKPLCKEDQSKVANEVYNSLEDLKKHNINDETAVTFAAHIVSSIPASAAPTDCSGIMASYLVLRESPSQ